LFPEFFSLMYFLTFYDSLLIICSEPYPVLADQPLQVLLLWHGTAGSPTQPIWESESWSRLALVSLFLPNFLIDIRPPCKYVISGSGTLHRHCHLCSFHISPVTERVGSAFVSILQIGEGRRKGTVLLPVTVSDRA
jgi:hypothetical protein